MIFGCHSSILHTSVDINIDIQARISMQGHSTMNVHEYLRMDIHVLWTSVFNHAFIDIH